MTQIAPLKMNSKIGILGGGQLARMLSLAAANLGYQCIIYCPEDEPPAMDVAKTHVQGDYLDEAKLLEFSNQVDVITYEFENIPAKTIEFLEGHNQVSPNLKSLQTSQDRLVEKTYLNQVGAETAKFANLANEADLRSAIDQYGLPAMVKTRTLGYDGKGQVLVKDEVSIQEAIQLIKDHTHTDCIYESFINFDFEISVIATRDHENQFAVYEPSRNEHKDQILNQSIVPANIPDHIRDQAIKIAKDILEGLDYIGTMGVELFVSLENEPNIIINEVAPRVHNSGHWTMDACYVSQFEQHIRAITNNQLGRTDRHSDVVMENLIGDDVLRSDSLLREANAKLHLYGKKDIKAGRKMGHVNLLSPIS